MAIFLVISFSVNFEASVQKATMCEIMRWIICCYFLIFILIGLRGLRGINSKNGVPTIESVVFYYGTVTYFELVSFKLNHYKIHGFLHIFLARACVACFCCPLFFSKKLWNYA